MSGVARCQDAIAVSRAISPRRIRECLLQFVFSFEEEISMHRMLRHGLLSAPFGLQAAALVVLALFALFLWGFNFTAFF